MDIFLTDFQMPKKPKLFRWCKGCHRGIKSATCPPAWRFWRGLPSTWLEVNGGFTRRIWNSEQRTDFCCWKSEILRKCMKKLVLLYISETCFFALFCRTNLCFIWFYFTRTLVSWANSQSFWTPSLVLLCLLLTWGIFGYGNCSPKAPTSPLLPVMLQSNRVFQGTLAVWRDHGETWPTRSKKGRCF